MGRALVGQRQLVDGLLHMARHLGGGGQVGAGQQHHKLFAAKTCSQFALAPRTHLRQRGGQGAQAGVPRQVAVVVVEVLEHVHIQQDERQRRSRPLGACPFARQGVVEVAAVGNAGEAVGVAQQLQAVVDLGQGLGAFGHQRLQLAVALAQFFDGVDLVALGGAVGDGDAHMHDLPIARVLACTGLAAEQHDLARGFAGKQCVGDGQVDVEEGGGGQQVIAQLLGEQVHHLDHDGLGHLQKILPRGLDPLGAGLDQPVAAAREAAEVVAEAVQQPQIARGVQRDVLVKEHAGESLAFR